MSFLIISELNEKLETYMFAAEQEVGEDNLDSLLKKFEYISQKSQYGDLEPKDIEKWFEDVASYGPKTEFFFAYAMQYSITILQIAAQKKSAEVLKMLESGVNKTSELTSQNFSEIGYMFQKSLDILGDQANETLRDFAAEFNSEVYKSPEPKSPEIVLNSYKKLLKLDR